MVSKSPNHAHNTQVMMGVKDQIFSQGFVYGERKECRELMMFDYNKYGLNSLNSQRMLQYRNCVKWGVFIKGRGWHSR